MRRLLCKLGWHQLGEELRKYDATGFWVFFRRECLHCGHRVPTGHARVGMSGRVGPRRA